jgi:hypothetical protein
MSLLPLALGLFGAEDSDVAESLDSMAELKAGIEISVGESKLFVCCFVNAIIGEKHHIKEDLRA